MTGGSTAWLIHNSGIDTYDAAGTFLATYTPAGYALDGFGDAGVITHGGLVEVWVSSGFSTVLRLAPDGTLLGTITNAAFAAAEGILHLPTGEVWIATSQNIITRYNANGTPSGAGDLTLSSNVEPQGLCIGPEGAVWVTNIGNAGPTILRFNADGSSYGGGDLTVTGYGPGNADDFFEMVRVGAQMWCTTANAATMVRLDGSGAVLGTFGPGPSSHTYMAGIDSVGSEVWVATFDQFSGASSITRYDTSATLLGTITGANTFYFGLRRVPPPPQSVGWFFTPVLKTAGGPQCIYAVPATGAITAASDLALGAGDFSIGGWFRYIPTGGLVELLHVGWASPFDTYLHIQISSSGGGEILTEHAQAGVTGATLGAFVPTPYTDPHHYVVTRSGTTLTVYVDGVSQGSVSLTAGSLTQAGGRTFFSDASSVTNSYLWYWGAWVGTVLSGADIAAWYAGGTSASLPGSPTHRWRMDEGTGLYLYDTAGSDDLYSPGGFTWVPRP